MKLLIAEDDVASRTMLVFVAKKWGFEPVTAENGLEVLDIMAAEEAPNLILLDWNMPEMDGITACQKIREKSTDNPPYIVMLTSKTETEDIVKGLDAGANDYIAKPFENTELRARLQVGQRMLNLQHELNTANQKLMLQATHDALTGLLNHGAILKTLNIEKDRAKRESKPLCIIMCDIDYFKKVNDNYGHLVGDTVLQIISQHLEELLRPYDFIGRYGGEEFLILLNANLETAEQLTERIRHNIQNTPIQINHDTESITITISIGLVMFDPIKDDVSNNDLLATADKALYQAKDSGRNRTCIGKI